MPTVAIQPKTQRRARPRRGWTRPAPVVRIPPPTSAALVAEIAACAGSASAPNWDGYGAEPLPPAVEVRAQRLARALPASLPVPEVAPAPSGSIDLEWRKGRGDCLALCVHESGPVLYDGRLGGSPVSGSFPLSARLPARVSELLRAVAG